jgi:hypothetical protein
VPIAAAVAVPIGIAAADQPQHQQGQLLIAGATPVKIITQIQHTMPLIF